MTTAALAAAKADARIADARLTVAYCELTIALIAAERAYLKLARVAEEALS